MAAGVATDRLASRSILTRPLVTTTECCRGCWGASGGKAEEKDHSSSSPAVGGVRTAGAAAGKATLDGIAAEVIPAKGSPAGLGGGAKAEDW